MVQDILILLNHLWQEVAAARNRTYNTVHIAGWEISTEQKFGAAVAESVPAAAL